VTVSAVPDEQSPEVGGPAEHRNQPGGGPRHRAGRVDPHHGADRRLPARHREQPGDPPGSLIPGHRPACRRRAVHLRRRSAGCAREIRHPARSRHSGAGGQQGGAAGRLARRRRPPRVDRLTGSVLHQSNPDAIARTVCGIRRMIKSTIVSLIGSRALLACDVVVLGAPGARPARRRPRGLRAGSHGADLGSEVQLPRNDQVGYPFHCQVRT